jgi:hypothetical protein
VSLGQVTSPRTKRERWASVKLYILGWGGDTVAFSLPLGDVLI